MRQGSEHHRSSMSGGVSLTRFVGYVLAVVVGTILLGIAFPFDSNPTLSQTFAAGTSSWIRAADDFFHEATVLDASEWQDTTRQRSLGGQSRRARALERKRLSPDLTPEAKSPSAILDSIRALPRDSSARLEQFQYVRRDLPMVTILAPKIHPMYLPVPQTIQTQSSLDSTKLVYRVRQTVGGNDAKIPVELSFEEYKNVRLQQAVRKNWEALAQSYELKAEKQKGLSELFGSVTNIEIPVPKNPLFSIFGPNIIRLQINGSVDIHGAFRNTKSDLYTTNPLAQSRSEPDFSQNVRVDVKGEIGDKLKIDANWDTERTFEYENQLHVRYAGYEDEIIQSIEAGNVSLSTNSAFIGSSQALFGIKAAMQFGPLKLTTVASQKKGQVKELSVSGGGKATPFSIQATAYSRDHYFIDTLYIPLFNSTHLNIPAVVDLTREIRDIEVWVTRIGNEDPNERDVVAFINEEEAKNRAIDEAARAQTYSSVPGEVEVGRFIRLDQADFTYDKYAGYITLKRSLQEEQAIAVAYTLPDPTNLTQNMDVGNFGSRDTSKSLKLVMKLVRPRKLGPQYKTAWRMMLKNIYPLGGRGIKKEGFELKVKYQISGKEPQDNLPDYGFNLIEMFELDRYDDNGATGPDGKFDYAPGLTIDPDRGELIFPRTEPFRESIIQYFLSRGRTAAEADSFVFHHLYDTTYNGAINSQRNKFLITGSITSSIASTYPIGFNVVEGSVRVIAGGVEAKLGEDYTVDYISGQVVIRNQSLLAPGTSLQITYEANDLLQIASKTLVGARGELNLGKSSAFGFTFMNLNQQSLSDKVRLGEEPSNNSIFGIDGATTLDLDFLTRAMNWLPGVQTNAPSTLTLRGEAAYMLPDPNTRKSAVAQDQGSGVAYIDDFEGARKTIPLSIAYTRWTLSSVPESIPSLDSPTKLTLAEKQEYRGRLDWYNVQPTDVRLSELKPYKSELGLPAGEDQIPVLNLYFQPGMRGQYNYSLDLSSKLEANPGKNWNGMQQLLGSTTSNLLDENISFIEFWVKIEESQPTVKLHIDMGLISEDVIPNNQLDTEDGLDGSYKNGVLDPSKEDRGLDGLWDDQERVKYADFLKIYGEYASDPAGDNWVKPDGGSILPEKHINGMGTEGNGVSETQRTPDSEDLDRNNVLDQTNSYFEYDIVLDTNSTDFLKYKTGGGANGWFQIRIPIIDTTRSIGSPTFTNVEAVRLWLDGAQNIVLVRLADINLVGNQWEELVKNDTTFRVSVVNKEDNPNYVPPIEPARDRTRPDQPIFLNEQSLDLQIINLKDGENRQAIKRFTVRPLDVFSYRTMKMFVHGDDLPGTRMKYNGLSDYDLEIFFRFGTDSLNYYEYRAPVRPGWAAENEIVVNFSEITAVKLAQDSVGALSAPVPVPNGPEGATYRVRGSPTLTNVRIIIIGVYNPVNKGQDVVTGSVWVNELRLTDVDDTPGWAYRFDTGVKFADVASIAFNMTKTDPFFHSLENRFGSRNTDQSWNVQASMGFERLLPQSWTGTSLGFTYSRAEQIQDPKYIPGTDIKVDEAVQRTIDNEITKGTSASEAARKGETVRARAQTVGVTETYTLPNVKLNVPVNSWLVTETINRFSFAYSYNRSTRRSPTTESYSQWQWNARAAYGLQFSERNYVEPFAPLSDFFLFSPWKALKFYFTPRGINVSATLTRGQTHEQARDQLSPKPTVRNFAAARSMNFSWQFTEGGLLNLGTEYSVDVQSTLLNLETDEFGKQRSFSDILGEMFSKSRIVNFGTDLSYGQTIAFNPRPVVPPIFKFDRFFSISTRYSSRYDWTNNLQAGELGKSASASGNLTMSFDVNMKAIGNELWSPNPSSPAPVADTGAAKGSFNVLDALDRLSRVVFKIPIFDFEKINISFSQQNRTQNSGVLGKTGFSNVFARVPFFQESLPENGPSLMYQLGLASDPHGRVIFGTKGSFPFFYGYTVPGPRAPNGNLVDIYSQSNRISMKTSRPLWEGASIELNWNVGWSYNVNKTIQSDNQGVPFEGNKVVSGDVDRSFLAFPQFLFFKFFKTSIEDVHTRYERMSVDPNDTRPADVKLAQAFEEGLEAAPFLKKVLGNLVPRPNWSIRWDGLEKMPLLSSFATRVSLDHSYTSNYKRRWKISTSGTEVTESQQITYGFSPLVGLNFTFKELLKGNFGASFRLGTTTGYDLTPSAQNIVESGNTDITLSANYSRAGFQIPFFGLSLSNDLDISFSYSYSKSSRRVYDLTPVNYKKDGTPLEGSSRTILEPRLRYILSSRVTASIYYKYSKTKPDAGGSRIPGTTVNEGGLDVRVAIQP